jgi:hypothetical protein
VIEAPSHLIKLGGGRIRVLRLAANGEHTYPLRYEVARDQDYCRVCGCTDDRACIRRCGWADRSHTVCTRCACHYPLLCDDGGDL